MRSVIVVAGIGLVGCGVLGGCERKSSVAEAREEVKDARKEYRQDVAEAKQELGKDIREVRDDAREKLGDAQREIYETRKDLKEETEEARRAKAELDAINKEVGRGGSGPASTVMPPAMSR